MKQILFFLLALLLLQTSIAQVNIQVRVRETSFSAIDPDGAGPAKGSVTFRFELRSTGASVLADGMGLSVVYQSALLMATPTNTTLKLGPINTALWTQQVDNRAGNPITPVTYGGRSFDRRMIITFNQNSGVPDATVTSAWTPIAQLTYYVLGATVPEGGYITPEPATIVAQNELSSDGGLSTYPYQAPEFATPVPLASNNAPLPVLLTKFDVQCQSDKSTTISWTTSQEINNNYFEVEKSNNGTDWSVITKVAGNNGTTDKTYAVADTKGGAAQYRLKQVDKDGKVTHSAIVKSACDSRNVFVNLYPVPARDVVNLVIGADHAVKTDLLVFDAKGKLVVRIPVSISNGINNYKIPVHQLAAGEYILRGSEASLEISKRFTIVR